ncbi:hypothetical protein ACIBF5_02400 [Micromonospora sp. NPDC050417]|uniref:hypothetical protein n=1 Tax=Micromonospora sp. NPDC050417 TaxID=3364280 RepID=UPI0037B1DF5D
MIELPQLVRDFASALQTADAKRPQATSPTKRTYQPGIGPHTEQDTIKLVLNELADLSPGYRKDGLNVRYPGTSRQRCDWCLGEPPSWDWAIEAKMLRLFGDNGKPNDNMLTRVLSPYPAHGSALTDCDKLVSSTLPGRKAILIFGYDYKEQKVEMEMEPAIQAFETLARLRVNLGDRFVATYDQLVHPVHKRGRVFAWEIASRE